MRLFLSILLTALIVPLAAYAQAPKQVEVINDPLAVEVVNPAPPGPPVRFQLVGFTTSVFGNLESIPGTPSLFDMIAACQAEVDPLSRMCRVDDIQLTTTIPSGLPTVDVDGKRLRAWLNPDPTKVGVTGSATLNCLGWSIASSYYGITVDATGQMRRQRCESNRPAACCALVP